MPSGNDGAAGGRTVVAMARASLLVAIVAVPAWCSVYSSHAFEPDKSWILVILMFTALGAAIAGGQRSLIRIAEKTGLAILVAPITLAATLFLSTLLSIQPGWSWWGSPQRGWGTLAQLAALAVIPIVGLCFRQRDERQLLVRALILSSVPAALIGLWQRWGWPLPGLWAGEAAAGRPFATLGNPVFLGSYLALVIPFTAVEAATSFRSRRPPLAKDLLRGGLLLVVLALQLAVTIWTRARGAWLGLGGVFLLILLVCSLRRERRALAIGTLLLLTIFVGGTLVLIAEASTDAPSSRATIGHLLDPTGSGRQRLEIWDQLIAYLAGGEVSRLRLLAGFGPDTQGLILPNHLTYRAILPDGTSAPPILLDRSHQTILDGLLTHGILGLAVRGWLALAAIRAGLAQLGLRVSLRALLTGGLAGVALFGGATFWLTRQTGIVPPAVGLGLAIGVAAAVTVAGTALRGESISGLVIRTPFITLAALGALFMHWIDLQFGFETQSAGLMVWAILALLMIPPAENVSGAERTSGDSRTLAATSGAIFVALFLGAGAQSGLTVLPLVGAIWLLCGILCGLWRGTQGILWYPLLSLGPLTVTWLIGRMAHALLADSPGWPAIASTGAAWMGALLCVMLASRQRPEAERGRRPRDAACTLLAVLIAILLVAPLALGDILTQQAEEAARDGKTGDAITMIGHAIRWGLHDAPAYDLLAQIELFQAREAGEPDEADEAFSRAADAMSSAWRASSPQTEYGRRLASIYLEWADMASSIEYRESLLHKALETLTAAQQVAPADPLIQADLDETRNLVDEAVAP